MTSQPNAEFDAYDRSYDEAVNASISFSGLKVDTFTKVKANYIHDLLSESFENLSDVSMLDIGCGIGKYQPFFKGKVRSLTGIDVSGACIERAKRDNPFASYQTYNGTDLPFESGSFDVAYAICVMHHVEPEHRQNFVNEMKRVLRPGGLAIVFEHNPYNILTRRAVSTCVFDQGVVLLKATETRRLFESAGLKASSIKFILTVPAFNSTLMRIDRACSALPLGAQYYVSSRA